MVINIFGNNKNPGNFSLEENWYIKFLVCIYSWEILCMAILDLPLNFLWRISLSVSPTEGVRSPPKGCLNDDAKLLLMIRFLFCISSEYGKHLIT